MIINLYHSLDLTVWLLLLLIIFPFAGFFHYIATSSRICRDPYRRPIFLDLFRSLFNQTLTHLPRRIYLRYLIIFWIIYCFLVTNILQSCLTSSLTVKGKGKDINSITDLSLSSYKLFAAADYANLVTNYFNHIGSNQKPLTDKLIPMPWAKYNQFIGNNNVEYAYLNKNHMTKYYASVKIVNGRPIYNAMKECLVPFLACYIVPFGSPFLGRINDIIAWTEQAGIFMIWERAMNEKPKRAEQQYQNMKGKHSALTFDQIYYFFLFWIGGLAISTCVFLGEMLLYRKPKVA